MPGDDPLCLLLLDGPLEEGPFSRRAADLMRAPAVVALEPGRRPPALLAAGLAKRVLRRVPGVPRVVILIGPRQYVLARALLARHPDGELWYAPADGPDDALARERATLVFDAAHDRAAAAFQANAVLWDRLEALHLAAR